MLKGMGAAPPAVQLTNVSKCFGDTLDLGTARIHLFDEQGCAIHGTVQARTGVVG